MSEDIARITIEIAPEQKALLQKHIPWGQTSAIMRIMIEDLIYILERSDNKGEVLGLIRNGELRLGRLKKRRI